MTVLLAVLFVVALSLTPLSSATTTPFDGLWLSWVNGSQPLPPAVQSAASSVTTRADTIAAQLLNGTLTTQQLKPVGEVDVVVSGGGNLDTFYLGIHMVFSRVAKARPDVLTLRRRAGASAGACARVCVMVVVFQFYFKKKKQGRCPVPDG